MAVSFAVSLKKIAKPWAVDLAALVALRHALMRAERGELTEAVLDIDKLAP
jgi:hypothetical protein